MIYFNKIFNTAICVTAFTDLMTDGQTYEANMQKIEGINSFQ